MRRIGHRGAKGHAPENTIESFEKALALGCDEVETDVWLADMGLPPVEQVGSLLTVPSNGAGEEGGPRPDGVRPVTPR